MALEFLPRLPRTIPLTDGDGRAPGEALEQEDAGDGARPWKAFAVRHPSYDAEYWSQLRALYAGGKDLLRDPEIMRRTFIRNNAEPDAVYDFRCAVAFYVNYCAETIDHLLAGLGGDPIRLRQGGKDELAEEWLREWVKDTNGPFGDQRTLQMLCLSVVLEALQVEQAWVELSMPAAPTDEEEQPKSLKEQESAGLLSVWANLIPAERVLHWHCDKQGKLEWALVSEPEVVQEEFDAKPRMRVTFTRYTRKDFARWAIEFDPERPPNPNTPVRMVTPPTPHTFGQVPLLRFKIRRGLWAMDKLESMARAHFNKRNLLDIAERRSLLPVLYEFLASEASSSKRPVSVAGQDPNRAVNQPRGPHHVQRRGHEDRAEFVGPDSAPFAHALKSCDDLRAEMHRVLHQMALAARVDSEKLRESGISKAHDKTEIVVVLKAIGHDLRRWTEDLVRTVRQARGEEEDAEIVASGADNFDDIVLQDLVASAQTIVDLDPRSPRALREIMTRVLQRFLPDLPEQVWKEITKELERNYAPETMRAQEQVDLQGLMGRALGDGDLDDAAPPGATVPKAPRPGPMVDTAARGRRR